MEKQIIQRTWKEKLLRQNRELKFLSFCLFWTRFFVPKESIPPLLRQRFSNTFYTWLGNTLGRSGSATFSGTRRYLSSR